MNLGPLTIDIMERKMRDRLGQHDPRLELNLETFGAWEIINLVVVFRQIQHFWQRNIQLTSLNRGLKKNRDFLLRCQFLLQDLTFRMRSLIMTWMNAFGD